MSASDYGCIPAAGAGIGRLARLDLRDVEAAEALRIVKALTSADLAVWIDGGWGIDALLGRQTRDHDDIDLVVELDRFDDVLRIADELGYTLAENYLPTRAVLRSQSGSQIDFHPVAFDENDVGWQRGAAPDGSDCEYPADGFGLGKILDEPVPCLSPELQITHHLGYQASEKDRRDMTVLAEAFDLPLPSPYSESL